MVCLRAHNQQPRAIARRRRVKRDGCLGQVEVEKVSAHQHSI
jgi:hypothetical protein